MTRPLGNLSFREAVFLMRPVRLSVSFLSVAGVPLPRSICYQEEPKPCRSSKLEAARVAHRGP
jgi:hypothetical protein